MIATEMLTLMNRTPFRGFQILMNDGLRLGVEHPYQISTSAHSACCTVYDDVGEMHIVSFRNIARVVTVADKEPIEST